MQYARREDEVIQCGNQHGKVAAKRQPVIYLLGDIIYKAANNRTVWCTTVSVM